MSIVPNAVIDSLLVILNTLKAGDIERAFYLLQCLYETLLPEEN